MNESERKLALAAYRERKIESGIYAVRCLSSGQIWVGSAPDLSTIHNRLWFTLRQGLNPHRALQEAWTAQGADAFRFEIVARLDDKVSEAARPRALREALTLWVDELQAIRI